MDKARSRSWVDTVHKGYNLPMAYKGDSVIVGIIDAGFDYTHPNFYDTSGINNYRIKRVWDQNATGTNPSGFSYGNELTTQTDMLNVKYSHTTTSHGTHVAGIAAGGGVMPAFKGVAPNSNLVLVATTMYTSGIMDGIAYIMNYATSVNKPCVINMSLGSQIGPHDGTSTFDKYCDSMVKPGKILVGAASNDGSTPLHIGKTFTSTDTILRTFIKFDNAASSTDNNGDGYIDMWGSANQTYSVRALLLDTSSNKYLDSMPLMVSSPNGSYVYYLYDTNGNRCDVYISATNSSTNNKGNISIYVDNSSQTNSKIFVVLEINAHNTQVNGWGYDSYFSHNGKSSPFVNGNTTSTIGEVGGTGNSIVSVGAYTTRKSWTALNGTTYSYSATDSAIASFSSRGPTIDGRTKPDVTAPGQTLISSVNKYNTAYSASSPYVVASYTISPNTWYFATMQGTSMASPFVTGVVALWLQAKPDLTLAQIKYLLKKTSLSDVFTGIIPVNGSNTWGWGKINAYYGLKLITATFLFDTTVTLCDNQSYSFRGKTLYSQGTYYDSLKTMFGKDSIYRLTLTVKPTYLFSLTDTICPNDSLIFRGKKLMLAGTYYDSLHTVFGCDSVYKLTLRIAPTYLFSQTDTNCNNASYTFRGKTLTLPGTYYDSLHTKFGCDSVYRLTLHVAPTYLFTQTDTICNNTSYIFRGKTLTLPGTYYDSLHTQFGCDSVYRLTLCVAPTYLFTQTDTICNNTSYTFRGKTLTLPGTYYDSLHTTLGCDSVYSLTLYTNPSYLIADEYTICSNQSYNFRGKTISIAGIYYDSLLTLYGCDSVFKLSLYVLPYYEVFDTVSLCNNEFPFVYVDTIFQVGTLSGEYTFTHILPTGCDSLVHLHLQVLPTYHHFDTVLLCQNQFPFYYGNKLFYQVGDYVVSKRSVMSCDSIIYLHIGENPIPNPPIFLKGDTLINSIGQYIYIVKNEDNVSSYKWNISNLYWTGSSTIDTLLLTVNSSGNGILSVIAVNNCGQSGASSRYINSTVDIETIQNNSTVLVFPNPAQQNITILSEMQSTETIQIDIFDMYGKLLHSYVMKDKKMYIDISSYAKGLYLIKMSSQFKAIKTMKIIKD